LQIIGNDGDCCSGTRQHSGDPHDIGVFAADMNGIGHRAWHQTCILATEEDRHELGGGAGNHGYPVKPLETGADEYARDPECPKTELAISEYLFELTASGIEIKPGLPARGIIEPVRQG